MTTEFSACAGGTLHQMTIDFITPENRAGALESGMLMGMEAGYEKLRDLLEAPHGLGVT